MQVLMSPFRFAGQWAMFPFLLILSLAVGAGVGVAHGWATEHTAQTTPILVGFFSSLLPLVIALFVLGLVTNSWTIAIIVGAAAAVSAISAQQLVIMASSGEIAFNSIDVVSDLPVALLAGAAMSLAGCFWYHEQGLLRAMGAATAAGTLAWVAWRELEPAGFPLEVNYIVGWAAGVLAVALVVRCGLNATLLLAIAGAVAVAALLFAISDNGTPDYSQLVDSLLGEARRWRQELFGQYGSRGSTVA